MDITEITGLYTARVVDQQTLGCMHSNCNHMYTLVVIIGKKFIHFDHKFYCAIYKPPNWKNCVSLIQDATEVAISSVKIPYFYCDI